MCVCALRQESANSSQPVLGLTYWSILATQIWTREIERGRTEEPKESIPQKQEHISKIGRKEGRKEGGREWKRGRGVVEVESGKRERLSECMCGCERVGWLVKEEEEEWRKMRHTHYPLINLWWQMDHSTFQTTQSCAYVCVCVCVRVFVWDQFRPTCFCPTCALFIHSKN